MLVKKLNPHTTTLLKAQYATVTHDHHHHHHHRHRHRHRHQHQRHWPLPIHPKTVPTPYQILSTSQHEPYSKQRFYDLVKLYHPDRSDHPASSQVCSHISEHERLERYRLIVAAHTLLSDPVRRRAYDVYGIGWASTEPDATVYGAAGVTADVASYRQRAADGSNGPWGNATWEDWAEYYHRQSTGGSSSSSSSSSQSSWSKTTTTTASTAKDRPRISNGTMASLIIFLSLLGGAAQSVHAESLASSRIALRDEQHQRAEMDQIKAHEAARRSGREGRIEEFVRQRGASALLDGNDSLAAMVMKPDLCESAHASGKVDRNLDMRRKWS